MQFGTQSVEPPPQAAAGSAPAELRDGVSEAVAQHILVTDGAAIYGYSGVGSKTGTSWFVPVGVGAEFAVADGLSLKAEYQHNFDLTNSVQDSTLGVRLLMRGEPVAAASVVKSIWSVPGSCAAQCPP